MFVVGFEGVSKAVVGGDGDFVAVVVYGVDFYALALGVLDVRLVVDEVFVACERFLAVNFGVFFLEIHRRGAAVGLSYCRCREGESPVGFRLQDQTRQTVKFPRTEPKRYFGSEPCLLVPSVVIVFGHNTLIAKDISY